MATSKAKAKPVETVEAEEEGVAFEVGQSVKFLGYPKGTPKEEQVLTKGESYEVVGITAADDTVEPPDPGGNPILSIANPDFNAKKKEHADTNPKFIEVEAFPEELELVEAEEEAAVEEAVVKAKPAAKTAAKAPAAKTAKAAAKTPAKKVAAKVKEEKVEEADPLEADLEGEDEAVLALVNESEDLIATAQSLESEVGTLDYRLGGVLYHLKKAKKHLEVVDEKNKPIAAYAETGGFGTFLRDFFNIDYRKAMYLIEIYVNFTLAGIENPADRVAAIGWTKASKIARHLVTEGAKPDELLELAETNSVEDLSTSLKEQVAVGGTKGTPGEKKTRVTLKFRFWEEEGKTIDSILATAQEQLGLKDLGEALSHIVTEWATANGGGAATAETAPKQTAKPAAKVAVRKTVTA